MLVGPHGDDGLRRCLTAESLLDLLHDWRDELLLVRDVRRIVAARGLALEAVLTHAIDWSSAETAQSLRELLEAG